MNDAVPEVDVWLFSIKDARQQITTQGLSKLEIERAARYRIPEKRRQFLLSRWICRKAVSEILQTAPEEIDWPASGPPLLRIQEALAPISISLSHSGESLAMAVCPAGWTVGIDIEETTHSIQIGALSAMALTSEERLLLSEVPRERQVQWMRQVWTAKEATLKSLQAIQPPDPAEWNLRETLSPEGVVARQMPLSDGGAVSVVPFSGAFQGEANRGNWEAVTEISQSAMLVGVLAVRERAQHAGDHSSSAPISIRLKPGAELSLAFKTELAEAGIIVDRLCFGAFSRCVESQHIGQA